MRRATFLYFLAAAAWVSVCPAASEVQLTSPVSNTLAALRRHLSVDYLVDVVLVGFNSTFSADLVGMLQAYLDTASTSDLSVAPGIYAQPKLLYRVVPGRELLASLVRDSILTAAEDTAGTVLLHSAVTSVLASSVRSSTAAYTMFLLNGMGERQYAYGPAESEPTALCGSSGWWGDKERFVWIDLAARANLGPGAQGGGIYGTSRFNRPILNEAGPDELHRLCASLATTVHRTMRTLTAAPLPVSSDSERATSRQVLSVTRFCDRAPCESATTTGNGRAWRQAVEDLGSVSQDLLVVAEQSCSLKTCPATLAALASSMRSRREHPSVDREMWIDSAALAAAMRGLGSSGECAPKVGQESIGEGVRMISVFIFDLRTKDSIFFDGSDQVVAYEDTILVIQTRAPLVRTKDICGHHSAFLDPSDASCPAMHEVFRVAWGITPLSTLFDPFTGRYSYDYQWARHPCDVSSSFFRRDSPPRFELFRRRNSISSLLSSVFGRSAAVGVDFGSALSSSSLLEAEHTFALLTAALVKASRYMALHNHAQAREHLSQAELCTELLTRLLNSALDECVAQSALGS